MLTNHPSIVRISGGAGAAGLLALLLTLVGPGAGVAVGAASDVRLATVDCAANPEVVEVKNFGTEGQDLTGWKLQSDGNDPFDLSPAGTIPAGGSIFIESGPAAAATFKWSQSQIFRDNDPTDYARLVDNAGTTKGQTACAQAAAAVTPTPTPTAGLVPNGGGPPGTPDGLLSPAMLIYAGGSIMGAVAGLAVTWLGVSFGLGQRRKRRAGPAVADLQAQTAEETAQVVIAAPIAAPIATPARRLEAPAEPMLLALVIAIAAAILVALLIQAQDSTGRR